MPDDTIVNGLNTSLTLNDDGIYKIDFIVTDSTGCRDNTFEDVIIYVSTIPDFRGTEAASNSICLGDSVDITGVVETVVSTPNFAPPVAGVTFLPDGNGTSYITCIDVNKFTAGTTLNSGSDLRGIFVNMEHSYVGDLDIRITAPNGVTINLFEQAGRGAYFGEPIFPDVTNDPGVGYTYNFTEGSRATETLMNAANNTQPGTSVPEGDYLPLQSFAGLVGTEVNGLWCIEVTDNLSRDNGYIFEWGLTYDQALFPASLVFEPQSNSTRWLPGTDIINTSIDGSVITVLPTSAGLFCYTYELVDSFNCVYIEEICIDVTDAVSIPQIVSDWDICRGSSGSPSVVLALNTPFIESETNAVVENYYNSIADAQTLSNPITSFFLFTNSPSRTVYVRFGRNDQCFEVRPYTVNLLTSPPIGTPANLMQSDLDGDSQEVFDLTLNNNLLLDGLPSNDYAITYYENESDALDRSNGITNPATYSNISNPQTIFGSIINLSGGCNAYRPFVLSFADQAAIDSDGDGVFNNVEDLNGNNNLTDDDVDNDQIPNYLDVDDDGDGILTNIEISGIGAGGSAAGYTFIDTDNDQVENYLDADDDGDGIDTDLEDIDNDGNPINDDTDNNQVPNFLDNDDDGDSVNTEFEIVGIGAGGSATGYTYIDTDNDLTENYLDDDDDGDGLDTIDEDYNLDGNPLNDDTNNNQIPDFLDDTVTLSISTIENSGVEIYPTMVDDRITIKFNGSTLQNLQVTIVDLAGKQIISNQLSNSRSEQSIDLSTLKQGMYLLLFNNGLGQQSVRKIVKK